IHSKIIVSVFCCAFFSYAKKRTSEVQNKHEEQRELDIEIHRLIVSPAQYRFQPVCHMCEVYSNAPGLMFRCRGPCGRLVHPACMRYKIPPPPENSREDRFRCPECLTGDFICRICGKPGDTNQKTGVGLVIPCQVVIPGSGFISTLFRCTLMLHRFLYFSYSAYNKSGSEMTFL
ncbi:putative set domain protein, partial [Fasciolopsis buskii]